MSWLSEIFRAIFGSSGSSELSAAYERERQKNIALLEELTRCKNEYSAQLAEATHQTSLLRIEIIETQAKLEELKALSESTTLEVNAKIEALIDEKRELEREITRLTKELTKPVSVPDITPLLLKENLKKQTFSSKPQAWWDFEKSLWIVFAKPEITDYEVWDPDKVQTVINSAVPNLVWHSPAKDGKYRIISEQQVRDIIANSFISLKQWLEEIYDCDKFAEELRTHFTKYTINSMMEVWGYWGSIYHERNLIPVKGEKVLEIEPQTGQIAIIPTGIGDNFKPDSIHDW